MTRNRTLFWVASRALVCDFVTFASLWQLFRPFSYVISQMLGHKWSHVFKQSIDKAKAFPLSILFLSSSDKSLIFRRVMMVQKTFGKTFPENGQINFQKVPLSFSNFSEKKTVSEVRTLSLYHNMWPPHWPFVYFEIGFSLPANSLNKLPL